MTVSYACPSPVRSSGMASRCLVQLFAVLFVAVIAQPAWARLGETEEQILQRFGEPFRRSAGEFLKGVAEKELYFLKGDIRVVVSLQNGRSIGEAYMFTKNGTRTDIEGDLLTQAAAIVEANSPGHGWKKHPAPELENPAMKHVWIRSDSQAIAIIWKKEPGTLEITTVDAQNQAQRSKQAADAGVGGF